MRSPKRIVVLLLLIVLGISASVAAAEPPNPGRWEWRFVAGGATVGPGAVDSAGTYYFTAEDRFLYALDRNGTMRWRVDLERRSAGKVAVGPDDTIVTVLDNGTLLALNKDGRLIWRYRELGTTLFAPVVLDTGLVVVAAASGDVVGITHIGREVWRLAIGDRIAADPILGYDARLYVPTAGGHIVTISTDGERLHRRYVGSVIGVLAPAENGLFIGTTDGHILRLDNDLEPLWRTDVGSAVNRLIIGGETNIYGILADGSLVHLTDAGVASWRVRPSSALVNGAVAVTDGIVVALSNSVLAHILPDGSLSWEVELQSAPLFPVIASYGVMIVPTEQWVTYSFATEGVLDGAWPLDRGHERLSGVPAGIWHMRVAPSDYDQNLDYIYLREFLSSPFEDDQLGGLSEIGERTGNLAGSYHYILELCEAVAGAPFTVQIDQFRSSSIARSARARAIELLGEIGDLQSVDRLVRILRYEPYTDLQTAIIHALVRLGSVGDGDVIAITDRLIRENAATAPDDRLAVAAIDLVASVYAYEGGFASSSAVDLLTRIVGANYQRSTREQAFGVLRSFGAEP